MKTNQQPLPTSPEYSGRSFLRSTAPSKSEWCAGSSLPFGKGWGFKSRLIRGWASILCIMLLTPLLFLGEGLGVRSFAQANGTGAGNCLSFDGVNDYVSVPHSASLAVGLSSEPFTIEVWFYAPNINQSSAIIYKRQNFSPYNNIGIQINNGADPRYTPSAGKKISFSIGDAGATNFRCITTVNDIVDGKYHHVCAIVDPSVSSLQLYIDGVLQSVNTISTGSFPTSNTQPFTFGSNNGGGFFQGSIDEVRIWNNRALTQTEIRDNLCKKLTGGESGLVGYWRFDEGSGSTVYDATTNGNNGTLY